MMAILWDDIAADLASARHHLTQAVALYRGAMGDTADDVTSMAFQHAMLAGYTTVEAALKRLLAMLAEPIPAGPDSHAALIRRMGRPVAGGRPALLDAPLLGAVEDLRRFRRVALHAYDDFAPRRALVPVEAAEAFLAGIDAAMSRFRAAIDPA